MEQLINELQSNQRKCREKYQEIYSAIRSNSKDLTF